ncbi:metallopeptidase domain-containing protein [Maribellus maritimus]|uniref:hypothetical protein n=1 Tax=Maribellus maritimus TaxID=2870838 RepID=UPI001EEBD8E6|nr:hypothetical protein [Maribellus maritimus]MCG6187844.1 hypothetical protein [Maribellus maritimus]
MKKIPVLFILVSLLAFWGCSQKEKKVSVEKIGPLDPQMVQDQDDMTWDDYKPIPEISWADPSIKPKRGFKMALIAVDFPDQPFVITQPKGSDLFGNPQIDPIKRENVAQFYRDFFIKPSDVNHGQTINGYWMEQSRGEFGITEVDAYGPYQLPKNLWEYGLNEWGQNDFTPDGSKPKGRMERDVDSLWRAEYGDLRKNYDAILRIYASYDETGVWQEFGEMKFNSKEDIPPEWGNPNPDKPRWVATRYVPWTSWKAGAMQWGISSIRQGENSGTITHELGHYAFRIGDNNNNPYVEPYRRAGSGPWDMMDRGCFNGPGGPHKRWVVPAIAGASMPAGLMVRNRMKNDFLTEDDILRLSRDSLAVTGLAVANITARAVEPFEGEYAGVIVELDGEEPHDRTPVDDPAENPLSPGIPNYDYYSLEVVQRIGYDSYCPDNGVLLAKNRDKESRNGGVNQFNCFNWVIDAHPEDINMVDYVKPNGEKVMRTIADYRQLNDALFHAGLNSGSEFEYDDPYNRLHFYIIDLHRNQEGILSYTIGVKSLDGSGAAKRDFQLTAPKTTKESVALFTLKNKEEKAGLDASCFDNDIYRLAVSTEGEGLKAEILNELVVVSSGEEISIPVYFSEEDGEKSDVKITLTAVSESDASKKMEASYVIP